MVRSIITLECATLISKNMSSSNRLQKANGERFASELPKEGWAKSVRECAEHPRSARITIEAAGEEVIQQ